MRIKILGKTWEIEFVPRRSLGKGCIGSCDSPDTPRKRIRIASGLKGVDKLDTIIHELLHAANFKCFDEDYVEELASDIARTLNRLGYRKDEPNG